MVRQVISCLLLALALAGCGGGGSDNPDPPATLTSIAVTPSTPSSQALANTLQFTATGTYSDGSTSNITTSVTWGSSSTAVATISAGGLATTAGGGSTTISASLSGVTGSTVFTVTPAMLTWDDAGWDTVYWQ
jgi:hypothetical protein